MIFELRETRALINSTVCHNNMHENALDAVESEKIGFEVACSSGGNLGGDAG